MFLIAEGLAEKTRNISDVIAPNGCHKSEMIQALNRQPNAYW